MGFRDLSILKKGLCLVAAPLALQIIFITVLAVSQRQSEQAEALASHSKIVMLKGEEVYRLVMQMHNSARGFVISSRPEFEAEFTSDGADLFEHLAELRALVTDNPSQAQRADAIAQEAEKLVAWLRANVQLVKSGSLDEARSRVAALGGRARSFDVRAQIDGLLAEESRIDRERFNHLKRARNKQNWTLVAAAVLIVFAGVALILIFSREFAIRVETLAENARLLAKGKPLSGPMTGNDELGYLDSVLHGVSRLLAERESENEMFIYSASHDLRSPLLNLKGFSRELDLASEDLVRELDRSGADPESRKRIDVIIQRDFKESLRFIGASVTRLSGIIDGLLRLSRAGRVEFRFEKVDLQLIVGRVVESLRSSSNEKGARIEIEELPQVWGDANAVEQVFANLITNALMYLDPQRPGLIQIGVLPEGGAVENAEVQKEDGGRTFFVRDNGLGIEEAHRSKLFLAFQRLHPEVAGGEGIGLAIVRRVIERLGGKIWVESRVGVGTTFYLNLPTESVDAWSAEERHRIVYGDREVITADKTELMAA